MKKLSIAVAAFALVLPTAAFAHTGVTLPFVSSASSGFAHPFSGLDHLLTMIAVGLWAASLGGRAVWAVPTAFVGVLALGAWLGASGVPFPAVEAVIAASVVVMGVLIAANIHVPVGLAAVLVGALAVFHGHAHGTEMPDMAGPLQYALGFMVATAILHGVGLTFGFVKERTGMRLALRAVGAVIAVIGLVNAVSVFSA